MQPSVQYFPPSRFRLDNAELYCPKLLGQIGHSGYVFPRVPITTDNQDDVARRLEFRRCKGYLHRWMETFHRNYATICNNPHRMPPLVLGGPPVKFGIPLEAAAFCDVYYGAKSMRDKHLLMCRVAFPTIVRTGSERIAGLKIILAYSKAASKCVRDREIRHMYQRRIRTVRSSSVSSRSRSRARSRSRSRSRSKEYKYEDRRHRPTGIHTKPIQSNVYVDYDVRYCDPPLLRSDNRESFGRICTFGINDVDADLPEIEQESDDEYKYDADFHANAEKEVLLQRTLRMYESSTSGKCGVMEA